MQAAAIPQNVFGKILTDFGKPGQAIHSRLKESTTFMTDQSNGACYNVSGQVSSRHDIFSTMAKTMLLIGCDVTYVTLWDLTNAIRENNSLYDELMRVRHLAIANFEKDSDWPYSLWIREGVEELVMNRQKYGLFTHTETAQAFSRSKWYSESFVNFVKPKQHYFQVDQK